MLGKFSLNSKLRGYEGLLKVVERFSCEISIVFSKLGESVPKNSLKIRASPHWKAVFSVSRYAHL